jgi:ArsR family transcriptional regulator
LRAKTPYFYTDLTAVFPPDNISKKFDMSIIIKDQKAETLVLLKALGNPIRLGILDFLISGEQCVCKIFDHLNLSQNLVFHHLGILRKNNLIKARKDGKWVHYSINPKNFYLLKNFANNFSSAKKNKLFNC